MREFEFIDWIRSQSRLDPAAVLVGPGDDMAVVACDGGPVLIGTDQVLDGVHFVLAEHGPRAAGRKAMARNLSDVGAMAALPLGAVAAVALPKGLARADAEAVYAGLREAGDPFDCPVVGGDLGSWAGPLAVCVTVFARPAGIEPVLRSGAAAGDAICVTGTLGGAWRSDKHLTFTPRIAEARTLAERFSLHAMIDVSDGLAVDLAHICAASGTGAELTAEAIPVSPAAGDDPLAAALGEGEDYELLMTLPADQADALAANCPLDVPVRRIGRIVPGGGLKVIHADGRREAIRPTGWEHRT